MNTQSSKAKLLSYYEHQSEKLSNFGKDSQLSDSEINKIIQESFGAFVYEDEVTKVNKYGMTHCVSCWKYVCISLASISFLLLGLSITTCALIAFHKPSFVFVIRNIQEFIYPSMKLLRLISLPVVTAFPSVTVWYDELCLLENPYFQAADINCWPCEEVKSVLDLSETSDPSQYHPHSGFPYVMKVSSSKVTYSGLKDIYFAYKDVFDRDASKISSNIREWNRIHDVMKYNLEESPTEHKTSHITWRINRMEPARIIRAVFKRPFFIPNTVNVERFILIDEPNSPAYSLPLPEGYRIFLMQANGERLVVLEPVPGCSNNCSRVSVLLQASDILYYNSWFYQPRSLPVVNSTLISITYLGSY